jgi:hypothetical protein
MVKLEQLDLELPVELMYEGVYHFTNNLAEPGGMTLP